MARNAQRRRALADAALTVLAHEGARGLTHTARLTKPPMRPRGPLLIISAAARL